MSKIIKWSVTFCHIVYMYNIVNNNCINILKNKRQILVFEAVNISIYEISNIIVKKRKKKRMDKIFDKLNSRNIYVCVLADYELLVIISISYEKCFLFKQCKI